MEGPSKDHWGKDKNVPLELFVAEDVRSRALVVTMLRGVRNAITFMEVEINILTTYLVSCRDTETCTTIDGQLGCCPVG